MCIYGRGRLHLSICRTSLHAPEEVGEGTLVVLLADGEALLDELEVVLVEHGPDCARSFRLEPLDHLYADFLELVVNLLGVLLFKLGASFI